MGQLLQLVVLLSITFMFPSVVVFWFLIYKDYKFGADNYIPQHEKKEDIDFWEDK